MNLNQIIVMTSRNYLLPYFIITLLIILCTHFNNEILSSKLFKSENIQKIIKISLLKAYANNDKSDSDSLSSLETVSMGSSIKDSLSISDSSDISESKSISSIDSAPLNERFKLLDFAKTLVKSKSTPNISNPQTKNKGIKNRFLKFFKKGNKNSKYNQPQGNISNSLEKQTELPESKKESEDTDDEDDDSDEESNRAALPPNPNMENIKSSDFQAYDVGIMQVYLESQVVSSDSQISKSKEILQNNKELYKAIKRSYSDQSKFSRCEESLLENILLTSIQLYMAKSYCEMAIIKITNEAGFCRNRCKIIHSKECKACRKAFKRKDQCKSISNRVDHMLSILERIIKSCLIKNYSQSPYLDSFKFYKTLTPFKCTREQYLILKGKLETKIFILSLKISYVNNVVRQKYVCSICTREECLNCASMAYCSQCPGLEDISSCSNCLAAQNLQSSLMLERNQLIKDFRRLHKKILSCENYLALTSGQGYITVDVPTESEVGKILEEKVNLVLARYLSFQTGHTHAKKNSDFEGIKPKQRLYRSLPDSIKNAILSGVKLKTPSHQKVETPEVPTQLSEAFSKHKRKREEKHGSQSYDDYMLSSSPAMESTEEERKAAVMLFENGICTYLMIYLLNQELRNCNDEIETKSNQHTGCEHCISDGCRKKRCSNFPEMMSLILKRENLVKELQRCNQLGFVSQTELKAKIDELKNSGLLSNTPSDATGVQAESNEEPGDDEDGSGAEITRL